MLWMVRVLSVKLTEYRILSLSMSVNSPYCTPTTPFRWQDGSGSEASFSIPGGESASRRPVCGWRCGADSAAPISLLWDSWSVLTICKARPRGHMGAEKSYSRSVWEWIFLSLASCSASTRFASCNATSPSSNFSAASCKEHILLSVFPEFPSLVQQPSLSVSALQCEALSPLVPTTGTRITCARLMMEPSLFSKRLLTSRSALSCLCFSMAWKWAHSAASFLLSSAQCCITDFCSSSSAL
ncbi:hypothetical protein FQN60_003608 [Etheostoma spectabile]|uniref:Uncharacterized protein n=1 Tax=Etheostoma spectabile TaxID=54343 RepID=A0A5J5CUQ3_9PERO|nr:hypothetical protein FQN60_003608 [Etheostoma spectabile]